VADIRWCEDAPCGPAVLTLRPALLR
jgi:hypothetical protein